MAAGTWRTRSLCTRCAARRPRPTANARPTTARRGLGRGPSGPAGNDGADPPPPRGAPPPAPCSGPPAPRRRVCPSSQAAHGAFDSRTPALWGAVHPWERPGTQRRGRAGVTPSCALVPGCPGRPTPSEMGAGVRLRRSHVSRAGGAPIPRTLRVSEPQCGSGRDVNVQTRSTDLSGEHGLSQKLRVRLRCQVQVHLIMRLLTGSFAFSDGNRNFPRLDCSTGPHFSCTFRTYRPFI